jgi:hypothetical protein
LTYALGCYQLFPQYYYLGGGVDSHSDIVSPDLDHGDANILADEKLFIFLEGDD